MRRVTSHIFCLFAVLCASSLHLFAHEDITAPQIVSNYSGDVLTIWMGTNTVCRTIQAATMPFGKGLTNPIDISDVTIDSFAPVVAMNDSGNAIVMWHGRNNIDGVLSVYYATLPAGGSWSAPAMVSLIDESVESIGGVTIDNSNKVVATWRSLNKVNHNVKIVVATAAFGGSWKLSEIMLPQ